MCFIGRICNRCTGFVAMTTQRECEMSASVCTRSVPGFYIIEVLTSLTLRHCFRHSAKRSITRKNKRTETCRRCCTARTQATAVLEMFPVYTESGGNPAPDWMLARDSDMVPAAHAGRSDTETVDDRNADLERYRNDNTALSTSEPSTEY